MGVFSSPSSPQLSPCGPLSKIGETPRQWSSSFYCHGPRQHPPPPQLRSTCTTNTSASSQGIIKPCAAIVLTYLGWLSFTRKLSFNGPFLWAVAPYVCIRPMCGEVTNPQKGLGWVCVGGGLLGGTQL